MENNTNIGKLLTNLYYGYRSQMKLELPEGKNVSGSQIRMMRFIRTNPGCSLQQLADDMEILKPAASKVLQKLIQSDLVVKESDVHDARRYCLSLSQRGEDVFMSLKSAAQSQDQEILGHFTEEERTQMFLLMEKLLQKVKEVKNG